MKIVKSKHSRVAVTVPVRGGFRVQFEGGRAVMPDDVAEALAGMGGGHYNVQGPVLEALDNAKVLIIRDTGLGDVLMTTPLARALHERYRAYVDVLTHERYRCLFDGNPHVIATHALETTDGDFSKFDVVLDLRLVVENAEAFGYHRHRADAFAAYADIELTREDRKPDYFITEEERSDELIAGIANSHEADPEYKGVVAYVWRSSTPSRNWSEATHEAVLSALIAAGYRVIVLDNDPQHLSRLTLQISGEARSRQLLDMTGELSLRDVAAVLEAVDVVVTPDTGLFHLAAAVGAPTVAYFGAFPVAERESHTTLTVLNTPSNCALFPCRRYRCFNRDDDGQPVCLNVIPAAVVAAVDAAIEAAVAAATQATLEKHDGGMGRSESDSDTGAGDGDGQSKGGDGSELDPVCADVPGADSA